MALIMAALYLASPGPGGAPAHRAAIREAISFAIKGFLITAGRTPDTYRIRVFSEGQVDLAPTPGPRLYLQDPTDGLLERFALMVTGPDRVDDDDRLATAHAAHERVPLGECAPVGYDAIVLPPEGRPPPEAPADLAGLAGVGRSWASRLGPAAPARAAAPPCTVCM